MLLPPSLIIRVSCAEGGTLWIQSLGQKIPPPLFCGKSSDPPPKRTQGTATNPRLIQVWSGPGQPLGHSILPTLLSDQSSRAPLNTLSAHSGKYGGGGYKVDFFLSNSTVWSLKSYDFQIFKKFEVFFPIKFKCWSDFFYQIQELNKIKIS